MKNKIVTLFIYCSMSILGHANKIPVAIDSLSPILHSFPKSEEEIRTMDKVTIPWETVSDYLLQIKNGVERNEYRVMEYQIIGRVIDSQSCYLLYEATDGFLYEVYMCVYSNTNLYPRTLKIYRSIAEKCEIEFKIDDGCITLLSHCKFEEPFTLVDKYKINPDFSRIYTSYDAYIEKTLEIIPYNPEFVPQKTK